MGTFDLFCSFCAGPLDDAHSGWRDFIEMSPNAPWPPKDGEWRNPPGYPVPSKSKEDIVCISPEDGVFWADWVCVGAKWEGDDWVSPPCSHGAYGDISIDGSSDWQNDDPGRYLIIHRGCLSFACRRLSITPKLLWESLYKPGSDYLRYGDRENGLLYCLKYYEMEGRNGQDFGYAITQQTPREDEPECVDRWDDPDSMEDTAWILTRPTCLPIPASIDSQLTAASEPSSPADCMKVFGVPELLNIVLSTIIQVSPRDTAKELKESAADFNPPSLISATQSVLALCQVNRFFHDAITHHRQGLFLHLALQFGWMLPSTPAEWKEWRDRAGPELDLRLDQPLDWRGYLLTFLRMEERVVKNRWRFHRMAVQCARGRARPATDTEPAWRWSVGELGLPSSVVPPEAWVWEFPPVEG
ncbi:hypothetical protein MVEN_00507500 [Mycena venus]|uniref:Uncharacterized protein n=1 Tax=Mycena venus TaxID=2733690 RepID=A0A8H6YN04_9AGAR|nr:hypothetical protein MVEN_00507500 [Mycena venus]